MRRSSRRRMMIAWQSLAILTSSSKFLKTLLKHCKDRHLQSQSVSKKMKSNLRGFCLNNRLIKHAIDSLRASKPIVTRISQPNKMTGLKKSCLKIKLLNPTPASRSLKSKSLSSKGATARSDCESQEIK